MQLQDWQIALQDIVAAHESARQYNWGPCIEFEPLDHLFMLGYISGVITTPVNNHIYYVDLVPTLAGLEYARRLT
jgi:hypothetical protein